MALETRCSIPGRVIPKIQKKYLMPPCLTVSIIRYRSRVKWSNPGNGVVPSLNLGVVANEKGAFGSPLTTVANFTYFTNNLHTVILFQVFLSNTNGFQINLFNRKMET